MAAEQQRLESLAKAQQAQRARSEAALAQKPEPTVERPRFLRTPDNE